MAQNKDIFTISRQICWSLSYLDSSLVSLFTEAIKMCVKIILYSMHFLPNVFQCGFSQKQNYAN